MELHCIIIILILNIEFIYEVFLNFKFFYSRIYTPFREDSTQSGGTKLWMSIANASIFICFVIVMTILLIVLYQYKCYDIAIKTEKIGIK